MKILKNILQKSLGSMGFRIQKIPAGIRFEPAMDNDFRHILEQCQVHHYQSIERLFALYEALVYIVKHDIPGDIVECGVYRGITPVVAAMTLKKAGDVSRKIYLYDTFEGMPESGKEDIELSSGRHADFVLKERGYKGYGEWINASIAEVKKNVSKTEYPQENFIFVKGLVEETIPQVIPERIALLRLDTDWYRSTYHELSHLYPRLSARGVMIVDDYGHWAGAKKAVDQYFKENNLPIFLSRIDYTGRLGIKC